MVLTRKEERRSGDSCVTASTIWRLAPCGAHVNLFGISPPTLINLFGILPPQAPSSPALVNLFGISCGCAGGRSAVTGGFWAPCGKSFSNTLSVFEYSSAADSDSAAAFDTGATANLARLFNGLTAILRY